HSNTTGYQAAREFSLTEGAARGTHGHLGPGGRDRRGFVRSSWCSNLGRPGVQTPNATSGCPSGSRQCRSFRNAASCSKSRWPSIGTREDRQNGQRRTVTKARLRRGTPPTGWDYDPSRSWLEWWDYGEEAQTRPYPQSIPVPPYRITPRHWSTGTPWYAN